MAKDAESVLIRCKLKRKDGSEINLFDKAYHFKPAAGKEDDPKADHTCAIPFDDAKAIYRLLSIKEGYELVDPDAELPPRPSAEAGQTIAGAAAAVDKKPVIITNEDGSEINLTALDATALRELARDTFKLKVHHKWTDESVIQKIVEATRGEG